MLTFLLNTDIQLALPNTHYIWYILSKKHACFTLRLLYVPILSTAAKHVLYCDQSYRDKQFWFVLKKNLYSQSLKNITSELGEWNRRHCNHEFNKIIFKVTKLYCNKHTNYTLISIHVLDLCTDHVYCNLVVL